MFKDGRAYVSVTKFVELIKGKPTVYAATDPITGAVIDPTDEPDDIPFDLPPAGE